MSAETIAILRIELVGIEPLIWRRVVVKTTTDLHTLHRVIQAAMGWRDQHLWEFTAGGKTYRAPDPEDADWRRTIYPADDTTLAALIESSITAFDYTYDMGDYWKHRITIERVETAQPDGLYPEFLGGERRCPPEDCGGISGYYEFLGAITGPDQGTGSSRKKEMLAWYGGPYDPDNIGGAQIRGALKRIATTDSQTPLNR